MWFYAASGVEGDAHLWKILSQIIIAVGDIVKVVTESILFILFNIIYYLNYLILFNII
jgi:hypothetical protein